MKNDEGLILSREEINTLIKAIIYLKFTCQETGSLLYAGSPLINSALDKFLVMYGYKSDWEKVFENLPEVNKKVVFNKILASEKENGSLLDEKIKDLIINYCLHPYKI
ncbi:Hypothetical protein AKI40_0256 [Enterobacter sp. FY-07]|uniref:hypothetical protein n=1 Tax=Kosakonia oryzendophytica TaxID=1005665 RepID=UPI000777BBAF|nr:hypothetical protein [Kosakonia oryzendophytica]AMO46684.1 Hypothetical protein AKI40_0256 [Enterobacter sp. FY-07]WBT58461.1 hypothetical protein O9K67_01265 [Kosakonia oryzendophytica]